MRRAVWNDAMERMKALSSLCRSSTVRSKIFVDVCMNGVFINVWSVLGRGDFSFWISRVI